MNVRPLPSGAEVVIIGGGVIGASIAYHMARRGMRPVLIERGQAGGHASLASAGLLHPMTGPRVPAALRQLSAASFACYPALTAELRETCGLDPQFRTTGFLYTAETVGRAGVVQRGHASAEEDGLGMTWLDGAQARQLEPALGADIVGALHAPRGAQVYVPALLQAYTQAAARRGATVLRGLRATGLITQGQRVTGVRTEDGTIGTDAVVLAGGAWTAQSADWLGASLPIYPLRGQILALYGVPPPIRHVVFGHDIYLAPKADGSVVVGATYERVGYDDRLTAQGVGWLLTTAPALVPGLAGLTFRQAWVGLRPASPDNMPLLGVLAGWDNVCVAAGHTAEGVLLSPITGHLIAQVIAAEAPDLDLAPFSPTRFSTGERACP